MQQSSDRIMEAVGHENIIGKETITRSRLWMNPVIRKAFG